MIKISRPTPQDAPSFCKYFFNLAGEEDLLSSLEQSKKLTVDLFKIIPSSLEEYRYAGGKWTLKMVFAHITDCERHYSYYAMHRSRKTRVEIAEFDQDIVALNANTGRRTLREIEEEYVAVREGTIKLFSYMTDEMLDFRGTDDAEVYTPRSLGWMASGHNIHHCNLIKEKYLK